MLKNGRIREYLHLVEYPHLLRFCIEKKIAVMPYSHPYGELVLTDVIARGIPGISRQDFRLRRKMIDACLEFGYRHQILDKDECCRLAGDDPTNFWSLVNEIRIGVWLERQGFRILMPKPPSDTGGKGDYLIGRGKATVFVEVKTIFGERYLLEQCRVTSDIAEHCKKMQLPVESLDLLHYPRTYDYKKEKNALLKRIEDTIHMHLPLKSKETVSYKDASGISLEVKLSPDASRVVSRQYGGFSNIIDTLRERLHSLQVSNKDIPSIGIIANFHHTIGESIIEDALYGTLGEDDTKPPRVDFYREHNGKWSDATPSEPSKLNSVFIIRFEPATMKVRTVDAYLCPYPQCEFSRAVFAKTTLTWRELDKAGVHVRSLNE